jgi:hypothetical protein
MEIARWSPAAVRGAWGLIALGILLRVPLYLANRSLWNDEASLAVNLVGRSFSQLCKPLSYAQGAPIGFLFLQRTLVLTLGESEFALRLMPLLSSIAGLLICHRIVRRCFDPVTGLTALAMMAMSKALIFFSVELKQYSSDAAVSLLIAWLGIRMRNSSSVRAVIAFGIAGGVSAWFSHPAVFVLTGVGGVLILECALANQWNRAIQIAVATTMGGASALCHYFLFASSLTQDPYLMHWWTKGMMPLDSPIAALRWLGKMVPGSFEGAFGTTGQWTLIALFICGIIALVRQRRAGLLAMLIAPVLVTLMASVLHKYPFSDRLILFLLPLLLLVAAAGAGGLWNGPPRWFKWLAPILMAALLGEPAISDVKMIFRRPLKEEMRPMIAYLKSHQQPGDRIFVHYRGHPAFDYYARRFGIDISRATYGVRGDGQAFLRDQLTPAIGAARVWVVRTTTDELSEHDLVTVLEQEGKPLTDRFTARNARVDLYDLSKR